MNSNFFLTTTSCAPVFLEIKIKLSRDKRLNPATKSGILYCFICFHQPTSDHAASFLFLCKKITKQTQEMTCKICINDIPVFPLVVWIFLFLLVSSKTLYECLCVIECQSGVTSWSCERMWARCPLLVAKGKSVRKTTSQVLLKSSNTSYISFVSFGA